MEEIICSQNINSTIFCYSMDFSGISKQNAHGERNVLPKMFVGRWWYFLEKCWKTGWSEQDVRDRRMLPWMATGAVPVRIRTATHFSSENSHRETLHRGRMSRPPWAFVGFTATLRYEPCIQFINVSQRTLHIYFIDGCRVCPLDARYKNRTKQPLAWASSHRGIPFYFCMARNFQFI